MGKPLTIDRHSQTSPELDEILRTAPESRIVKPQLVGEDNLPKHLVQLLHCHSTPPVTSAGEDYQRYQKAVEHYGLTIKDGKVFLRPITDMGLFYCDGERFTREDGTPFLVHIGRFRGSRVPFSNDDVPFDNIDNLQRFGVFGNPSEQHGTYLQRPDAQMTLFGGAKTDISLFVDVKELLQRRSVFVDPETIRSRSVLSHERLGGAYFIVGGVPKEAIFSYKIITATEYNSDRIRSNRIIAATE